MTVRISRSARLFQERRIPEDKTTRRLPSPRSVLGRNLAHQLPLQPPYPTPEALREEGRHIPVGGMTTPWLYGTLELTD